MSGQGAWSHGVSGPWGCLALEGAWSREGSGPGGRVPGHGGCLVLGEVPGGNPPWTATAAGGTHPTGMHSC